MKRIFVYLILIVLFNSCDKNKMEPNEIDQQIQLSEKESYEIISSKEFIEYFDLRYDFMERAIYLINSGFSAEELTEICLSSIHTGNHDVFYKTFYNSIEEGQEYMLRLNEAHNNLNKKFPVLHQIQTENFTYTQDVQVVSFFNKLETGYFLGTIENYNTLKSGEVTCGSYWQQVKLAACATGCSFATAGVATPLCGWACWCMLCNENSEVADLIC